MRNAPHLPTAFSLAQVPHSVGRPWTDTNRTARFFEGPPVRRLGGRKTSCKKKTSNSVAKI
jgi:hypothetical protein